MNQTDKSFDEKLSASVTRPYRGTIWENASRFKLVGKAYQAMHDNYPEQDEHFCIESARQLQGPLTALNDSGVRMVIEIGATQVLKSVAGDIWVPYVMEHQQRNILVLFETDPKALVYCDTRLMETIKNHPVLKKLLEEVNRHDVTKTEIKIAGAKLLVGGMNDSNCSSLSWPIIWISEAWIAKSNGLLNKAIKRADRFPNDAKIFIESQAGLAGEDLHSVAKGAHPVPLTWACPFCGGRQEWEFSQCRPDGFKPLKTYEQIEKEKIADASRFESGKKSSGGVEIDVGGSDSASLSDSNGVAIESNPKSGTFSGMRFDPEEKENADGTKTTLTIEERARSSKWECYHCGTLIEDTRENRIKIRDSYEQDYKITLPSGEKISPKTVCFYIPKEAAPDNSFEESTRSYLSAKESDRMGNRIPLQNWYMSERAKFFDPSLTQKQTHLVAGSYDTNIIVPDEHSRNMAVDCQKHQTEDTVGTFWYIIRVYDKYGNSWQLERGFARSWKEWIDRQHFWKIPNARVVIDSSKWTPQIMAKAAAEYKKVPGTFGGRATFHTETWQMLFGDAARAFPHGREHKAYSMPIMAGVPIRDETGRMNCIRVKKIRWSNLAYELQLDAILAGTPGMPKFHILAKDKLNIVTQTKETGILTYDSQMKARVLAEIKGKQKFEDLPNREAHYRDCELMLMVRASQDSLLGHNGMPSADEQTEDTK